MCHTSLLTKVIRCGFRSGDARNDVRCNTARVAREALRPPVDPPAMAHSGIEPSCTSQTSAV
jgi:hypothetical protein